eukprot:363099-Chlamydomonas_euryale.AAC.1
MHARTHKHTCTSEPPPGSRTPGSTLPPVTPMHPHCHRSNPCPHTCTYTHKHTPVLPDPQPGIGTPGSTLAPVKPVPPHPHIHTHTHTPVLPDPQPGIGTP